MLIKEQKAFQEMEVFSVLIKESTPDEWLGESI